MEKQNNIYPIILAGGSGTRLWPLSRELTPKQLINLTGQNTLLDQTIERAALFSSNASIIVTNNKIHGQVDKSKLTGKVEFLIEPSAKNTGPAIALAACEVVKKDPEGILVVLSADHYIDDEKFTPFIKTAIEAADSTNRIVLIGIKPTRPETGYGYIKTGEKVTEGAYAIEQFAEKPAKEVAEGYLKEGSYLWNAGIFVAKARVLKEEFEAHLPGTKEIFNNSSLEDAYEGISPISIDQGLLEKTQNIAVVPADATWNDLGSWGSIYDISPLDKDSNYIEGNVIADSTTGSLILARGERRVATIGLKNVVIVDTEDAVLICDRDNSQEVKKIVEKIKEDPGSKDSIEHKTMHRPWGRYTVLDEGSGFKVKFIHVNPGGKLSLQSHSHRSEHWVVVKGEATITISEEVKILGPNESIYVPVGTKHRLENAGQSELTIVEVATGAYIEEDDIQRYEDVYERAS